MRADPSPNPHAEGVPRARSGVDRVGPVTAIILFDLDGTLVLTGGAGRRAMQRAFGEVCGRPDALDGYSYAGKTDQLIVRTGLRNVGLEHSPAAVDAVIEAYLGVLAAEVEASPRYRVLPGVLDILRALDSRSDALVGLGTGNVEPGALIKLRRGGLDEAFTFGGFGSDHEDRAEILRAGAMRGADLAGRPLDECSVVIVGDTPLDVAAAHAIGARCVGVGTGGCSAADLIVAGADAALDDLSDSSALDAFFP